MECKRHLNACKLSQQRDLISGRLPEPELPWFIHDLKESALTKRVNQMLASADLLNSVKTASCRKLFESL